MLRRLMVLLLTIGSAFLITTYATDTWIFAFAPTQVDQLTIVYLDTNESVILSNEQASALLAELRNSPETTAIVEIASDPATYPVTHKLITREGSQVRTYNVVMGSSLVADADLRKLRELGPLCRELITSLKPLIDGQIDIVVPDYVLGSPGEEIAYTRYVLPVAYASSDFRVYTGGTFFSVDWDRQVLIMAAWGQKPSTGYTLQIDRVSKVDTWLKITVTYRAPVYDATTDGTVTSPADAVLLSREDVTGLQGALFVDQAGRPFASQSLGLSYPVERAISSWQGESLPQTVPATESGVLFSPLVNANRVQTLIIAYDAEAKRQLEIYKVMETAQGKFDVYVREVEGDPAPATTIIQGWGSNWSFRLRR